MTEEKGENSGVTASVLGGRLGIPYIKPKIAVRKQGKARNREQEKELKRK